MVARLPGGVGWPSSTDAATQLFVDDLELLDVDDDDRHHLDRVLRLRAGEVVIASDGRGSWRPCRYDPAGGQGILTPDGPLAIAPTAAYRVTVAFVPVKGERPEWVVQKLTELGVDRVLVLQSARSVVRWQGERAAGALDRLRRVARHAAAQSRRARLPLVEGVFTPADLGSVCMPETAWLAELGAAPLEAVPGAEIPGIRCVAIGPEGGWDPDEKVGFGLVGLGNGVLRAETAALAAGTLLCALRDGFLAPPQALPGPLPGAS